MGLRNFFRKITPEFVLKIYRNKKKQRVRSKLASDRERGDISTEESLIQQLKDMGIKTGDVLLVHSSLSAMGYVEGGAGTVIEALIKAVGENGHILMPTSPNSELQLNYIKNLREFDVLNSPSALGKITELFRQRTDTVRSWHPTEPVSCWGKEKNWFIEGHFGEKTPYTEKSPFHRLTQKNGKILMIGVTLINAGTNLHLLEDAVEDFKYPVYCQELYDYTLIDPEGNKHQLKTKVHNPIYSAKRRCDELIPFFENQKVLKKTTLGKAPTLLIDAKNMLEVMIKAYYDKGITMYTPQ